MDKTLKSPAGEVPKRLLRVTSENLKDSAVDVENLPVVVPVDEKTAGHLVGKALDLPGGEAFPALEVPAGGKQVFNQAVVFNHGGRASFPSFSLSYHIPAGLSRMICGNMEAAERYGNPI